jgi:hypothetical protein
MRRSFHNGFSVQRQRGFWLRCFLGKAFQAATVLFAFAVAAHAQLDMPGPIHLTHVEGLVADDSGQRIAGVEVTLARDGRVMQTTHTDQSGRFKFAHAEGRFTFQVARTKNAPAVHEVVATEELITRAERKKLYVIVGPGACADACSSIYTSKAEFDKALKHLAKIGKEQP